MARTSAMTGGTNSFQTTSEDINKVRTNFFTDGPVGAITNTSGVAPMTGVGAVNAQSTPNMTVQLTGGDFLVTATPTSQASQRFNVTMDANSSYTINSNTSGGTRYDYIYVSLSAALLANPDVNGSTVGTWYTSRSTSSSTDNGTPPTYGYCVAVVTVTNGAASITNGNITDSRVQSGVSAFGASVTSDGSLNPSVLKDSSDRIADYVKPGTGVVAISSGLVGTFSDITYYISGKRYTKTSIANKTYTASKDTYVDINTSGTITYTEVANNAASPSLAASSIRVAIVVTNGSAITSVNQGSTQATAPTVSSNVLLTVCDSLGNLIYPTSPNPRLIGYRNNSTAPFNVTTTNQAVVSITVIIPPGRQYRVLTSTYALQAGSGVYGNQALYDGTITGTTLKTNQNYSSASAWVANPVFWADGTNTTSSPVTKTFTLGAQSVSGTASSYGSSLEVELV